MAVIRRNIIDYLRKFISSKQDISKIEKFLKAENENHFLVLSTKDKVSFFIEQQVYVRNSYAYKEWLSFSQTQKVQAFAIHITDKTKGLGIVTPLNYKQHVSDVMKNSDDEIEKHLTQLHEERLRENDKITELDKMYEKAPKLVGVNMPANYKKITSFNEFIIAMQKSSVSTNGYEFVVWQKDQNGGVINGHYTEDFSEAKRNFVQRSGLVEDSPILNRDEILMLCFALRYSKTIIQSAEVSDEFSKLQSQLIDSLNLTDLEVYALEQKFLHPPTENILEEIAEETEEIIEKIEEDLGLVIITEG